MLPTIVFASSILREMNDYRDGNGDNRRLDGWELSASYGLRDAVRVISAIALVAVFGGLLTLAVH